jgi:hypothetical protein
MGDINHPGSQVVFDKRGDACTKAAAAIFAALLCYLCCAAALRCCAISAALLRCAGVLYQVLHC